MEDDTTAAKKDEDDNGETASHDVEHANLEARTRKHRAEMVAMARASQEIIWTRRLIQELMGFQIKAPTPLYCDNRSALQLVDKRIHHCQD